MGGGAFLVPVLYELFSYFGVAEAVRMHMVLGTSLAVIIPTALMGTWKHNGNGNVDWKIALLIAPMAIIGSYFAAQWVQKIPSAELKRVFGGFIILVGIRLAFFK